jgi:hypothetical protein
VIAFEINSDYSFNEYSIFLVNNTIAVYKENELVKTIDNDEDLKKFIKTIKRGLMYWSGITNFTGEKKYKIYEEAKKTIKTLEEFKFQTEVKETPNKEQKESKEEVNETSSNEQKESNEDENKTSSDDENSNKENEKPIKLSNKRTRSSRKQKGK